MKKYIQGFMRYRYLLKELVYKGIKLKYRRSYLGLVWTLLEPLLTTMVLAFVFGELLGNSHPVSYTHLDVYKRQQSHECRNGGRIRETSYNIWNI